MKEKEYALCSSAVTDYLLATIINPNPPPHAPKAGPVITSISRLREMQSVPVLKQLMTMGISSRTLLTLGRDTLKGDSLGTRFPKGHWYGRPTMAAWQCCI